MYTYLFINDAFNVFEEFLKLRMNFFSLMHFKFPNKTNWTDFHFWKCKIVCMFLGGVFKKNLWWDTFSLLCYCLAFKIISNFFISFTNFFIICVYNSPACTSIRTRFESDKKKKSNPKAVVVCNIYYFIRIFYLLFCTFFTLKDFYSFFI